MKSKQSKRPTSTNIISSTMESKQDDTITAGDTRTLADLFMGRTPVYWNIRDYNTLINNLEDIYRGSGPGGGHVMYHFEYFQDGIGKVFVWHTIHFSGHRVKTPSDKKGNVQFPRDAVNRGMTYDSEVWSYMKQMRYTAIEGQPMKAELIGETVDDAGNPLLIPIARLPAMVGGITCTTRQYPDHEDNLEDRYDEGGYLIIRGVQRTIVPHEAKSGNRIQASVAGGISIRSENQDNHYFSRTVSVRLENDVVKVVFNSLKSNGKDFECPLWVMMKALGVPTDQKITDLIMQKKNDPQMMNLLFASRDDIVPDPPAYAKHYIENSDVDYILNQKDALDYMSLFVSRAARVVDKTDEESIARRKREMLLQILAQEFLSHIGKDFYHKAWYLGHMVNRLLSMHLGRIEEDNRDSFVHKRIDGYGRVLEFIIRNYLRKQIAELQQVFNQKVDRDNPNAVACVFSSIRVNTAVKMLRDAISTGNIHLNMSGKGKATTGVSQAMTPGLSRLATISHMRKVVHPVRDANKSTQMRMADASSLGYIDPFETPEGTNVGITKNLALSAEVTQSKFAQVSLIKDLLRTPMRGWESSIATTITINQITTTKGVDQKISSTVVLQFNADSLLIYIQSFAENAVLVNPTSIIVDCGRVSMRAALVEKRLSNLLSHHSYVISYLEDVLPTELYRYCKIFINGSPYGLTEQPQEIIEFLRQHRRHRAIDYQVSLIHNAFDGEIHINTDSGRLIRPLIRVIDDIPRISKSAIAEIESGAIKSWNEFITRYPDSIEYICPSEMLECVIATTPDDLLENRRKRERPITEDDFKDPVRYGKYVYKTYTHLEIHPSFIAGIISSTSPFYNHNQAPRIPYYCAQAKQSIGVYSTNWSERFDRSGQLLLYPQKPLVTTMTGNRLHMNELPTGQNIIVAVACYGGYNQEDSLIMNQSAIERGLFRSQHLKVFESKLNKNPNTAESDKFVNPDESDVSGMRAKSCYSKLNPNGFVDVGTTVEPNDIIIGKVTSTVVQDEHGRSYKDASTAVRGSEAGEIDKIAMNKDQDGYTVAKVRIRQIRSPKIGDKFSSRHGQKGVIGITYRQDDMPFTESGITPDIIMNPHAFPSRMTIGQFLEMITGKIGAIQGTQVDGTAHEPVDYDKICDQMEKLGYSKNGRETMYCGFTGKKMQTQIFIAPCYYMRLKHMVDDKIHARARGPLQVLTHQPVEGRVRDGGLRVGGMERDTLISHGICSMLKERMMDCSDGTVFYLCDICGQVAAKIRDRDVYYCKGCDNYTNITATVLPYALKLLQQQLAGIHINMHLRTENSIAVH